MSRNRKGIAADILPESEKRMVAAKIFDGRFYPLIDFDLFHAGVAFDVKNAIAREQVVVELLRAADIQDGIGVAIKLADFLKRKAGGWVAGEIARAETPAALEIELRREMFEDPGGVTIIVGDLESIGVVRKPRGVLDVKDIVPEFCRPTM